MGLPHTSKPTRTGSQTKAPLERAVGNRWFWLLLGLAASILGAMLVFGNKGLYHLYQLRQERDRLLASNLALKEENDLLLKAVQRLQHDREYIEDIIRRELNYIKPNEIIFQLEPEVGSGPRSLPAPAAGPPPAKVSNKPTAKAPLPDRRH